MEVTENILMYLKKKEIQNLWMSYFSPLYQLQLLISENRPVRLVAVLLECTTPFCVLCGVLCQFIVPMLRQQIPITL